VIDLRPEIVAAPRPGNLELLEVRGGDLVQRRISRVVDVAADVAPFAGGSCGVCACGANPAARSNPLARRAPFGVIAIP
jgi:hypothetical protein